MGWRQFTRYLTNLNGIVYFRAHDGSSGDELWRSNGTAGGTYRVKDIRPGTGGSSLEYLTNINGLLYFMANDGSNGFELWRSDGTEAGTNSYHEQYCARFRILYSTAHD